MNLKEQAKQFVQDYTPARVAEELGIQEKTVATWARTGNYPVSVIELMMDVHNSSEEPAPDTDGIPTPPENENINGAIIDALGKLTMSLGDITQRLEAIEQFNYRPEPVPVQGPRVVNSTAAEVMPEQFQTIQRLGGNKPYEAPEPTVDTHGMSMKSLLQKRQSPAEQLGAILSKLGKA